MWIQLSFIKNYLGSGAKLPIVEGPKFLNCVPKKINFTSNNLDFPNLC